MKRNIIEQRLEELNYIYKMGRKNYSDTINENIGISFDSLYPTGYEQIPYHYIKDFSIVDVLELTKEFFEQNQILKKFKKKKKRTTLFIYWK
ncbi:hypothetical protein NDK43_25950 [Neobacillus pocheonensis]|uniref:Uncharacterized protein n=1 Tax=Neobacillus pocheonensis TaxID=363869 RepID=A0ABT0WFS6_9BACI|nr:hypothetical protein [Neobacillus pocheonensis]